MSVQTGTALDLEELRALVAGALELPVEEVTDDARFKEDLEVDSLISLEIAVRLEERYGVKVDDAELAELGSFRKVGELVRAHVDGGSPA
ncbi:acyl carrier protein [Streptomyces sp. URMC 123]|uniref:acyl carrier protein n=1 Tax=Streptomyces sp. URMC 123 TaxID=3423403 RepID=UPI003F1B280F